MNRRQLIIDNSSPNDLDGATAMEVNVVGLFPNKAVVQIEGGALRTLSIGQKTLDHIILLSVGRDSATFDIKGQRVALAMGTARTKTSPVVAANYARFPLTTRNFVVDGQVESMSIICVDTRATFITFPAGEANRLGLDYDKGQKTVMETANGDVQAIVSSSRRYALARSTSTTSMRS